MNAEKAVPDPLHEDIARYLDGQLEAEERDRFEARLLDDDALAEALYAAQSLAHHVAVVVDAAPESSGAAARTDASDATGATGAAGATGETDAMSVTAPARKPISIFSHPAFRVALPLAAAVAILFVLPRFTDRTEVFRGNEPSQTAVSPSGALEAFPELFRWQPIEGATRYRFELYDSESERVFQTISAATELSVSVEQAGAALDGGMWLVVPLDAVGRELGSGTPVFFRVAR